MPPEVDESPDLTDLSSVSEDENCMYFDESTKTNRPLLSTNSISKRSGGNYNKNKPLESYTLADVSLHNTKDDAWLIYNNQVLDVSKWITSHPGGEQEILRFAGMDATDELRAFHADWVLETKLPHFVI